MTEKKKINYYFAYLAAKHLSHQLAPYATDITIGGSLRRYAESQKPVGDIELIMRPKFAPVHDMFGEVVGHTSELTAYIKAQYTAGRMSPRINAKGDKIAWVDKEPMPRYVALWWDDMPVDLFIVNPDRNDWWGWTMYLRTGPGDCNRMMVTSRRGGGLLPSNITVKQSARRLPCSQEISRPW